MHPKALIHMDASSTHASADAHGSCPTHAIIPSTDPEPAGERSNNLPVEYECLDRSELFCHHELCLADKHRALVRLSLQDNFDIHKQTEEASFHTFSSRSPQTLLRPPPGPISRHVTPSKTSF
ncbi:unnamed protein product [Pleuronectes platessa]|uniref:Uncharacterized protein n=1 Tax=Pleuronectes platessa TaxID=8262 RepID=A0A9N7TTD0_PLEPL|nr:unnamed protein product [Pleuronectes platessa]